MHAFPRITIPSHRRSQIALHARRLLDLHPGVLDGEPLDEKKRKRTELLGLSGEFAVATVLGKEFVFREMPNGDGGVDLWNRGTSIDVKTLGARPGNASILVHPARYRATVMVYVRQVMQDRFADFDILGWLFASEVRRLAAGQQTVSICPCELRPVQWGLPPDPYADMRDPDAQETCGGCGRTA